jgi:hypothetical protein
VLNTANRIIVEGDDGVQRIVEDAALQPPVRSTIISVPGTTNPAILTRIGTEYLAARKVTPWEGELGTFEETLRPGDTIQVSDSKRGLTAKTVRIERLVWKERDDRSWPVVAHWSTERVLQELRGIRNREQELLQTVQRTKRSNPRLDLPQIEPPKVHEPRVIPPAVVRNPKKRVPAQADEAVVAMGVDEDEGTFAIRFEATHAATDVKLAIGAIIKARNPITVNVSTTDLEAGEGVDIFNNGTRQVEIGTTSAGAANRWTVNDGFDEMEVSITGSVLEDALVIVFLANLDGVDTLDAVTLGDNTIDVDVAVGRQKSYQFSLQVQVPGRVLMAGKEVRKVVADAQSGQYAQAFKGERDGAAGLDDRPGAGRFAGDFRTRDGVNLLINPDDGKVGTALAYQDGSGVDAYQPAEAGAETTTGKSWTVMNDRNLDNCAETTGRKVVGAGGTGNMDHVKEGTTYSRPRAAHMLDGRVREIRRVTPSAVNLDADDLFDTTRETTQNVTEAGNVEFVNGNYTDGSRRPILLRRAVAAEDLDPDDVSSHAEVEENLGGDGVANIRDSILSTELIDRTNEEVQNMYVLNNCFVGNPDGSEEAPNTVRAGSVRGLEVIDSNSYLNAYIREGVTAASEGASTWGVQWSGDGSQLTSSSGTGESGGGSGDSGGGDRIP